MVITNSTYLTRFISGNLRMKIELKILEMEDKTAWSDEDSASLCFRFSLVSIKFKFSTIESEQAEPEEVDSCQVN